MSESVTLKFLRKVGENGDYVLSDYKAAITWLNTFEHKVGQPVMVSYYSSFDEPGLVGTKINAITAMGIKEYPGPNSYIITSNQEIENSYYITSSTDVPCASDLVNGLFAVCYNNEGVPCYCRYNSETSSREFTPIQGDRSFYNAADGFIWFASHGVIKRSDDFLSRDEITELVESLLENYSGKSGVSGFKILPLDLAGNSSLLNVDYYNEAEIQPPIRFNNSAKLYLNGNINKEYSIKLYTSASVNSVKVYSESKELLASLDESFGQSEVVFITYDNSVVRIFKIAKPDYYSNNNSLLFDNKNITVRDRLKEFSLKDSSLFYPIIELIGRRSFPININLVCDNKYSGSVIYDKSDNTKVYLAGDYNFNNYIIENLEFYVSSYKLYIKSKISNPFSVRVNNNFSNWKWIDDLDSISDVIPLGKRVDSINELVENSTELVTAGAVKKAIDKLYDLLGKKVGELSDGACHTITVGEKTTESVDNDINLTEVVESLENKSNVLDSNSTDEQYPTSKVVYDNLGNLKTSINNNTTEINELKGKNYINNILLSTGAVTIEEGVANLKGVEVTSNKVTSFTKDSANNVGYPTTKAVVDYIGKLDSSKSSKTITATSEYDEVTKYSYQGVIKVQIPTKLDVIINTDGTENRVDTIYIDKKGENFKITSNIYKDFSLGVEKGVAYVCIPALKTKDQISTTYSFVSTNIGAATELSAYKFFKSVVLSDYVGQDTIGEDTISINTNTNDLDLKKYRNIIYTGKSYESILVGNDETDSLPTSDTVYHFINSGENKIDSLQFYGYDSSKTFRGVTIKDIPEGSEVEITYLANTKTYTYKILNPEHYSSDNSVHIKMDAEGKWDYSILNKDIINYLEDLCTYKEVFKAGSVSGITLTLPTVTGTGTAKFTTGNYRGLDNPTYTANNPRPLNFIESSCESCSCTNGEVSFSQNALPIKEKIWTANYKLTDLTKNSDTIDYKFNFKNADNATKTMSGSMSVTINKPWFIITTLTTDAPSKAAIESLINSPSSAIKNGTGNYTNAARSDGYNIDITIDKAKSYMWIIVPSNKTATFEQKTGSPMESNYITVSDTKYGDYRCYRTTNTQTLNSKVSGYLKIN